MKFVIVLAFIYFLTGTVSGNGKRRKELPISDVIPADQDGKPKASGRNFSSSCKKMTLYFSVMYLILEAIKYYY